MLFFRDLVYTIIDRYYKMKTQPIKNRILAMKLCKPKDIEIYNPRTGNLCEYFIFKYVIAYL